MACQRMDNGKVKTMAKKIGLGDKVKDRITGFDGIVVCRAEWLNGCVRFTVQPTKLKDGRAIDTDCFDENQLVLLKAGAYQDSAAPSGGPRPKQRMPPNPSR